MKKNFITLLAAVLVGASLISSGDVVKASTVEESINATVEKKEMKNRQYYLNKLEAVQEGLSDLDKYYAGTTLEMRYAANEEYTRWNTALYEIYADIHSMLGDKEQADLEEYQGQWLEDCKKGAREQADIYKGGTVAPFIYVSYLAEATKERCYELVYMYM